MTFLLSVLLLAALSGFSLDVLRARYHLIKAAWPFGKKS